MFAGARRFCFSFAGGYALTDTYIRSASVRIQDRLDDLRHMEDRHRLEANQASSSWWPFGRGHQADPPAAASPTNALRLEIHDTIKENQVASLVALFLLVMGGGPAGCAGAIAAVAFDGPDGNERYWNVLDRLDDLRQ